MRKTIVAWVGVIGIILMAMVLAGCQTQPGPMFSEVDGVATNTAAGGAGGPGASSDFLHVGDMVRVTYVFNTPTVLIEPHEERIKDDGTITPPFVGSIKASGKRVGELQKELQALYEKLYNNITVTVNAGERYYYVDGEVMQRGAKLHLGKTDLVQAIAAAGGFTEFANKRKVRVIRPNGDTQTVNYNKAISNPASNVPVYPGDKVWVPRRWL